MNPTTNALSTLQESFNLNEADRIIRTTDLIVNWEGKTAKAAN